MKRRVLIVEDDAVLSRVLKDNMILEGFDVRCVGDGNRVIPVAREFSPNLVILDLDLPERNGIDVIATWRDPQRPPIVVLTGLDQKAAKVQAFKCGADDYITKPFDLEELIARIGAILRRTQAADRLELGSVTIDFGQRKASSGTQNVELTHREFELLQYLVDRADRVVYRDELLRSVWGYSDPPMTRSVDHAVARLRKKIEPDPGRPRFIHTVHGDGYCLTPSGKRPSQG